ncbi:NAD(P)-dependent oxidoreductase [Synechococcus sp. ROS8604]|uniref:NAD-dependent epimerase/dehydratase family protein n=1 Tax=Synechococcus sp. ROS8604 TaxID=1442557 RepID=UPI0016466D47|nr:NAD-dependent epimerase/dehydratase family protein [Synechococcus sp. ROS8604]QNI86968.1 NAD dependent epimerase/dehydratase family protein [Synechococcus sp. ROS8604]
MRLLITGGTGFIGSYVLSAAMHAGHDVLALRRNSTSTTVIPLETHPEWLNCELADVDRSVLKDIDVLIHLAATGVSPKPASWSDLVNTNVSLSLRLMELAADAGVRRFIAAGTSHEYGATAELFSLIPPNAALEPLNAYGASKACSFQLLRAFAIQNKLELFYGRLFNVYGIGQFSGNFWPSLRHAALNKKDFPMTSGDQVTDFMSVSSAASHFIEACHRSDIKSGSPLVVNIGSGDSMSLLQFATTQWESFGAIGSLLPGSIPSRSNQIMRMVPDLIGLHF